MPIGAEAAEVVSAAAEVFTWLNFLPRQGETLLPDRVEALEAWCAQGGRMYLANGYLRDSFPLEVRGYKAPSGNRRGQLKVVCRSEAGYLRMRRLVDEVHGSALTAGDGSGQWYIQRLNDDWDPAKPLPQDVTVQVREHRQDD